MTHLRKALIFWAKVAIIYGASDLLARGLYWLLAFKG
jgi:hypothetical protein